MKSLTSALIAAASGLGFAARFNQMITPQVGLEKPAPGRRRRPGIGIKGMASSNMTVQGANLKAHFDRKNNTHARQQRHEQHLFHVAARKEIRRRTAAALMAA